MMISAVQHLPGHSVASLYRAVHPPVATRLNACFRTRPVHALSLARSCIISRKLSKGLETKRTLVKVCRSMLKVSQPFRHHNTKHLHQNPGREGRSLSQQRSQLHTYPVPTEPNKSRLVSRINRYLPAHTNQETPPLQRYKNPTLCPVRKKRARTGRKQHTKSHSRREQKRILCTHPPRRIKSIPTAKHGFVSMLGLR